MATSLKTKKVHTHDSGAFSETVEYKILHCSVVEGNSNKFYAAELQKNPSTGNYRIFTHYGRLGVTDVYEIREQTPAGTPISNLTYAKQEFDKLVSQKLKKRSNSGSTPYQYFEVQVAVPKVGSTNIRGKNIGSVEVIQTTKIATADIVEPTLRRLIDQVVEENIHHIKTVTALTLTSSGFETPLGPVTSTQVDKARGVLQSLQKMLKKGTLDPEDSMVRDSNNTYYSLIPHDFGSKIQKSDWILDEAKLIEENDLLDQLAAAVQMGSSIGSSTQDKISKLGIDIELVTDKKDVDRVKAYIIRSRSSNHSGVFRWEPKNVFKLRIPKERERYEKEGVPLGNVKELFHGSRNCNIMSIMLNGLIIPPCNAPGVTGRMFGDGLYYADSSTKSMNYSLGNWGGSRNKYPNAFLFLANVALGKSHLAKRALYTGVPKGYNSIFAEGGADLINNEYIVPSLHQATMTYLVEMADK